MSRSIYRFLDANGDGTGTKDSSVDGSSTQQVFKYVPKSGDKTFLHRLIIHVEDSGSFDSGSYGNGITLTNGVGVEVRKITDDSVVLDLMDGVPVTKNPEWGRFCYDVDISSYGAGTESLTARWTFEKSGQPLFIQDDEYFCVTINDDLTGLVEQYFNIQGVVE